MNASDRKRTGAATGTAGIDGATGLLNAGVGECVPTTWMPGLATVRITV